jgi:hypothetical protein
MMRTLDLCIALAACPVVWTGSPAAATESMTSFPRLKGPGVNAKNTPLDELPLLIFCEFSGGWDTLMSLEPRDHSNPLFNDPEGSIYTGYDMLAAVEKDKENDSSVTSVLGDSNNTYASRCPVDLATGAPEDITGTVLRPPDIHRTLLHAAGLSYDHLSNEDPVLIQAMLSS